MKIRKGGVLFLQNMGKGFDLHTGKETWKELERIHRFGYSNSTIFSDFIDVCLFSLLSLTENMQYPDVIDRLKNNKLTGKYEDAYMKIVEKYKENKTAERGTRSADYFASAWGHWSKKHGYQNRTYSVRYIWLKLALGNMANFLLLLMYRT